MNIANFFSSNKYLFLPTSSNPKVALVIDNTFLVSNSFKLYNPFSSRAKYLKLLSLWGFTNINKFSKTIGVTSKEHKGAFIKHLEDMLQMSVVSSVYFATAKDKVVLQIQVNQKIMGYVKFPLNKVGIKHLETEIKAIEILAKKKLVAPLILKGTFNQLPYLFLSEIQGEIKKVPQKELQVILKKLKKQNKFLLMDHPFVKKLKLKLTENSLFKEKEIISKICVLSQVNYFEVYEHGDFAPWNLITTELEVIPFDFEYFEENGLEYMDLIKFYFQTGALLNRLNGRELINYIYQKLMIPEKIFLLKIYLIKEISRKTTDNEVVSFEEGILKLTHEENK